MNPTPSIDELAKAAELVKNLRAYEQADEEGVMVLASRQAIEESADLILSLTTRLENAEKEVSRLSLQMQLSPSIGKAGAMYQHGWKDGKAYAESVAIRSLATGEGEQLETTPPSHTSRQDGG